MFDFIVMLSVYGFLLIHRPAMREKHMSFFNDLFTKDLTLKDMNPDLLYGPSKVVLAMGLSGGRWRVADYGDHTIVQPISSNGLNVGFPRKVKKSFGEVLNRLTKK